MITADTVKPGSVVIDVGINRVEVPGGKAKLVGDVDFASVEPVASAITPVTGRGRTDDGCDVARKHSDQLSQASRSVALIALSPEDHRYLTSQWHIISVLTLFDFRQLLCRYGANQFPRFANNDV